MCVLWGGGCLQDLPKRRVTVVDADTPLSGEFPREVAEARCAMAWCIM